MINNNDCKIVHDLLPNYIDGLTSKETSDYIKDHLNSCKNCNKNYSKMNMKLESNLEKSTEKEINFFKKYKKRLFLLKLIVSAVFLIFIIFTARKMIIISSLSNKAEKLKDSNNYHSVEYHYNYGKYEKVEVFKLDDKYKIIMSTMSDENYENITIFMKEKLSEENGINRYLANMYVIRGQEKTAYLNENMGNLMNLQNVLYTENLWNLFINSIQTSITATTLNGKDCYFIANFNGYNNFYPSGVYIDKETGMPVNAVSYEYELEDETKMYGYPKDFIYEFNTVDDDDFIEPSIEDYQINN